MEIKKNQYYFKDMDYYICETPKILLELIDERKDILKDALCTVERGAERTDFIRKWKFIHGSTDCKILSAENDWKDRDTFVSQ